jgi:hypothetical protein
MITCLQVQLVHQDMAVRDVNPPFGKVDWKYITADSNITALCRRK